MASEKSFGCLMGGCIGCMMILFACALVSIAFLMLAWAGLSMLGKFMASFLFVAPA